MRRLHYEQLRFLPHKTGVKAVFLQFFSFTLDVGTASEGDLLVDGKEEKQALLRIQQGLRSLVSTIDGKPAFYADEASGLPLVGLSFLGLVDRDTNILEVKPVTGCNINCTFCSVDEGTVSRKTSHFVAEADYLVRETEALAGRKTGPVHIYINPHGEPLLYADLERLIKGLRTIPKVGEITFITNGVLLSKERIDMLADAGLSHLNVSLHALDPAKARMLAGRPYPVAKVQEMIAYAGERQKVVVSPVLLPGVNEQDVEEVVAWIAGMGNRRIRLGIQNFLPYKRGRNPVKPMTFEAFASLLKVWEKRYGIRLLDPEVWISVREDAVLERPYRVGETVTAKVIAYGRYRDEFVAATDRRAMVVRRGDLRLGQQVQVRIVKNKHNIYYAA